MKSLNAQFVWTDHEGVGRNLYANFRKTFEVKGNAVSALIHIFADTSYQLFVNNQFVEFGPVRFDPKCPLYDTIDISNYLTPGLNVIAIVVNHFGCKTYKSIITRAGLIAWGSVETDQGETIELDTVKDSWKCMFAGERSRYMSKISFALNPCEIFDQGKEQIGWKEPTFDDSKWPHAVVLPHQHTWGNLETRSIPFMSGEEVHISALLKVLPTRKNEELYSFSVPLPHFYEDNRSSYSDFIAFSTWVYSPFAQTITVGTFWGEYWLNGNEVEAGVESSSMSMRINQRWKLNEGWNYLFGKVEGYVDILDQYFAFPSHAGIVLSAKKDTDSPYLFKHTSVLSSEVFEKTLAQKALPYVSDDMLEEIGGWVLSTRDGEAQNACRETSWDHYDDPIELLTKGDLCGHTFTRERYPDGFCILLDLDFMHLIIPKIRFSGVKDAVIDIMYSEQLKEDHVHLNHLHTYSAGDRIICSREDVEWMPAHPRGARYLKITVRNTTDDVKFEYLRLRSANYPVKKLGSFKCSDTCLNQIWEMGERTLRANMEDAYVDCSGRERGMYGRDTIIQYHINMATFGDHSLMRRCMELYGQSPDETGKFRAVYPNSGNYTIADFALNMVEGYLAYYESTGDLSLIDKYWDAIKQNLKWFHNIADEREDLLLDAEWNTKRNVKANYGGFHGDRGIVKGYLENTGIHCMFSCTYLIALRCAHKLADVLNKKAEADQLQQRINILSKSISEKFWDEKKECFSDNFERNTHSAHANLFAIRAGVASSSQVYAVQKYIKNNFTSVFVNGFTPDNGTFFSPHFAFYIFDGLYLLGLSKIAQDMIRQGWGWMLMNGFKTCPEYFQIRPSLSLCHAWSASPTYYLSRYVLGISYKAPQINKVYINVLAEGIQSASGTYPHPKGLIEIAWHMEENQRIFDYVKAPKGVEMILEK